MTFMSSLGHGCEDSQQWEPLSWSDEEKFEVSLDSSQYRPDELRVNVKDGVVSVEKKHEDKS